MPRLKRSYHVGLPLGVAIVLLLSACGGGAAVGAKTSEAGSGSNVLRIAVDLGDLSTLDPAKEIADASQAVLPLSGDMLVDVDPTAPTKVIPMLAEKWDVSADSKQYTFHLRKGVRFSTGAELSATDVKFSFDRLRNLVGPPAFLLDTVKQITVVDPLTVQFDLSAPDSALLAKLAAPYLVVLDSKELAAHGAVSDATAKNSDKVGSYLDTATIGSGQYLLKEWKRNERLVFEANPKYWGEKPKFAQIVLLDVREAATQSQLLQRGDADVVMNLDSDTAKSVENSSGVKISSSPSLNLIFIAINNKYPSLPQLADVRVRQAIQKAIDYDGIAAAFSPGAKRPAAVDPLGLQGSDKVQPVATDVVGAKKLLADAGVTKLSMEVTFANQVLYGVPLTTLWEKIKSDLSKIGVEISLKPVEYSAWLSAFRAQKIPMTTGLWAPDYIDTATYLDIFGRTDGLEVKRVSASFPEGDKLYAKYLAETNDSQRSLIATEALTMMRDDSSLFPVIQPNKIIGFRDDLTGVRYSPNKSINVPEIAR